jgi:magnesium transporter
MAKPMTSHKVDNIQAEELLGLSPGLVASIANALDKERIFEARIKVEPLRAPECADLLQLLPPELRRRLVQYMRQDFDPEILPELEEDIRNEIAEALGTKSLVNAIRRLELDDALEFFETLDELNQSIIFENIPPKLRYFVKEGLNFPEDSAGRLMERDFVAVPEFWTIGQIIDFVREAKDLPKEFYDIFVVDPKQRPLGKLALSQILRNKRSITVKDLMNSDLVTVPAMMDQEEVAYLFQQQNLVSAPVVDNSKRLIGTITVDDVLDVIQEEAEEDIMHLGGVSSDDFYSAALETGRSRFSWLFVNLITAIIVSIVIGVFEGTIEKIVMLAVLMPIVASMGGNAGTQTMTVAVRALATKELTKSNAMRVLAKEALVGIYNGVLFALLIGCLAWYWADSWKIGAVMAIAMIVTLVLAAFSGIAIPLALARTGIDPAVASSVLLTTITDVVAFSVFLGLAALLLL